MPARFAIAVLILMTGASCSPGHRLPVGQPGGELAGRTPGPAQACVPMMRTEALRFSSDRVLTYGRGQTVWVIRLQEGCSGIRPTDTLVVKSTGTSYCRGDLVQAVDPVSGRPGPGCFLTEFIPYRR